MEALTPHNCFIAPLLRITADLLDRVFADVIAANAPFIEELNRKQLTAGLRADSTPITPYFRPNTVQIKLEKGQPIDRVRLHDTGDFYDSIFVDVFEKAFDIDATDEKTGGLKAKYGDEILGLTEDNKRVLYEHIKPQFITRLRAEIGL